MTGASSAVELRTARDVCGIYPRHLRGASMRDSRQACLLFIIALVLGLLAGPATARGLEVQTLEGETSSLAAQIGAGHFTYVLLWTTYCDHCKRDYPGLSRFQGRHHGKDAEVLGVALDGYGARDTVRQFMAGKPFDFPTVLAEPEAVKKAFEAATGERFTGTPSYLVFNPARELAGAHSGNLDERALEGFLERHRQPATPSRPEANVR
jgi:hypothetical protein